MTESRSTVVRRLSAEVKPIVRIMLVDPRPHSRSILKGFLRNLSIVQYVYERASSADLVQSLTEFPVHLVMLEQQLGSESGLSVVRTIQSSGLQRKPRFMLMTGEISESERREATELGVRAVLVRPYDVNTLERSVLEALGATNGDIQAVRSRTEHLRRLPAFTSFTDQELARVLKLCPLIRVPAGQPVYMAGQSGRSLYMLLAGQVQICQAETEIRPLALLQPGECFGESAMVHSGTRRLGAQAVSDTWVLEVSHSVFCNEDEPVALKLVRQIALQVLAKMHAFS